MRDRREAAAKVTVRRHALVTRLAAKSGVMHKPGSMYGICYTDVNGARAAAAVPELVGLACLQTAAAACRETAKYCGSGS